MADLYHKPTSWTLLKDWLCSLSWLEGRLDFSKATAESQYVFIDSVVVLRVLPETVTCPHPAFSAGYNTFYFSDPQFFTKLEKALRWVVQEILPKYKKEVGFELP